MKCFLQSGRNDQKHVIHELISSSTLKSYSFNKIFSFKNPIDKALNNCSLVSALRKSRMTKYKKERDK